MEKETDKILAFDTLFTNNHIQMYKILLSYLQPTVQKQFAVYIKLMELQYTISFFQNHPLAALKSLSHEAPGNTGKIVEELLPFCTPSQHDKLNQMKGMLQNFENMKEMMETIQMMKELFPEGMGMGTSGSMGENTGGNANGMDMSQLFSMFGGGDMSGMADMLNMFQMFNTGSSTSDSDTATPTH